MDAEVGVKTTIQRAAADGFVEVEDLFFTTHVKAKMPFADHVGGVTLVLKQVANGFFFSRDDGLTLGQQGVEYSGAHGVYPGEQSVTGGGAGAGCRMSVVEAEPLCGELIKVRGFYFGLWVGDAAVSVAEVIGKDEDHVGEDSCAFFASLSYSLYDGKAEK